MFIIRTPECASLKNKMTYASPKDVIKKKLTGIKHESQANCYEKVKGWRASCCELPPGPCLEHLSAPDLLLGVSVCPFPARPEGLEGILSEGG